MNPTIDYSLRQRLIRRSMVACFFATFISAWLDPAQAQQPAKIPRIGYVSSSGDPNNPGPLVHAFRQGLRDLGYIEGKNIVVEYRHPGAEPDRVPSYVAAFVQQKVDILVSSSVAALRAAKEATKTIPIVMVASFDPVATGMVDSLARPGGNITGVSRLTHDLSGKRLELLKEAVPAISRVGILAGIGATSLPEYKPVANALKISLDLFEIRDPNAELAGAFQNMLKRRLNALITIGSGRINRHRKEILDFAIKNRLPSLFEVSVWVEAGGLISYSSAETENFKRAAAYVDKILKGAKPADLPVEQPTKFEFVINLKTAKQIGVNIPQSVLFRADKVIR